MGKRFFEDVPFPELGGDLAREFGLSFSENTAHNGRGPKGSGKGAVMASWIGSEEAREDNERVFGSDPIRQFRELDEMDGGDQDNDRRERELQAESLIEVFEQFGAERGRLEILRAATLNPGLLAVVYTMARWECLANLLRHLPMAAEVAIERLGAERVIDLLEKQEVTFGDRYYISSIRALQDAASIEKGEYETNDRAFPPAAGRILLLLEYTPKDVEKRRPRPTGVVGVATRTVT